MDLGLLGWKQRARFLVRLLNIACDLKHEGFLGGEACEIHLGSKIDPSRSILGFDHVHKGTPPLSVLLQIRSYFNEGNHRQAISPNLSGKFP